MPKRRKLLAARCAVISAIPTSGAFWSKTPTVVVPGQSIAGIQLGMSRDKVISVLGKPAREITTDKAEARALGSSKLEGALPRMTLLSYKTPPVTVVLHDQNKVGSIQPGFTEDLRVQGYDFLAFRYLSLDELDRLGKARHNRPPPSGLLSELLYVAPDVSPGVYFESGA